PKSHTTSTRFARTVTVSGPDVAVAVGMEAAPGPSQNHDGTPVQPCAGLAVTPTAGHGCSELAWSTSPAIGPGAEPPPDGVDVGLGTQEVSPSLVPSGANVIQPVVPGGHAGYSPASIA